MWLGKEALEGIVRTMQYGFPFGGEQFNGTHVCIPIGTTKKIGNGQT